MLVTRAIINEKNPSRVSFESAMSSLSRMTSSWLTNISTGQSPARLITDPAFSGLSRTARRGILTL